MLIWGAFLDTISSKVAQIRLFCKNVCLSDKLADFLFVWLIIHEWISK
jgi:hypothetical protein